LTWSDGDLVDKRFPFRRTASAFGILPDLSGGFDLCAEGLKAKGGFPHVSDDPRAFFRCVKGCVAKVVGPGQPKALDTCFKAGKEVRGPPR
jgi:hypothetical protein